jgi:hypothetical protein
VTSELAKGPSLPAALRRFHDVSNGRLEIMALLYDLDGALEAGQNGMAHFTAVSLLEASVALWLRDRGIAVPAFAHIPSRARVTLSLLTAVNPGLASRVSRLYRAALPPEEVSSFCQEVLSLVGELSGYGAAELGGAVSGWAELAKAVRDLCQRMGVPLTDFYWAPPGAGTWHSDALAFAAGQAASDQASRR